MIYVDLDASEQTATLTIIFASYTTLCAVHRTAKQCCEKHFSYLNINTCEQHSFWSVDIAKENSAEIEERPKYYYPDLYGRDNCVYWNGYYDWMTNEGVSDCFICTI